MFEVGYRVRSTQVDQLGHLNNAAFMEIFEWARWEWGEAIGFDFGKMIREEQIGPVILHADLSFRREVRFHEKVRVVTRMGKLEDKKGTIIQTMFREDGELAAELHTLFVMIDLAKRRSIPMPAAMREAARENGCPEADPG